MDTAWSGEEDTVSGLSPEALLQSGRQAQLNSWAADIHLLRVAAEWANSHPEEILEAEWDLPSVLEPDYPVAGPGAPDLDQASILEFAKYLHMSDAAASALIGAALELQHRLPLTWKLVTGGHMAPWEAKLLARESISHSLTPEAASWVDRQVNILGGRAKVGRLIKLAEEAAIRFMADDDGLDPELGGGVISDSRHVTFHDQHVNSDATMHFDANLDLADAYDLEHAIVHGAETLKALGSKDSLEARRAIALGELARTQTALDLAIDTQQVPENSDDLPAARRLDLTVHLQADVTEDGTIAVDPVALLERNGGVVLFRKTIEDWCKGSRTEVRVLPVLDLNVDRSSPGYRPGPLLKRHVRLRDGTCYFPWCERPAVHCDLDHIERYEHEDPANEREGPPQTRASNQGPGCRHHHRAKTFDGWKVFSPLPGVYIWTSPHGHLYLRDHRGTTAL